MLSILFPSLYINYIPKLSFLRYRNSIPTSSINIGISLSPKFQSRRYLNKITIHRLILCCQLKLALGNPTKYIFLMLLFHYYLHRSHLGSLIVAAIYARIAVILAGLVLNEILSYVSFYIQNIYDINIKIKIQPNAQFSSLSNSPLSLNQLYYWQALTYESSHKPASSEIISVNFYNLQNAHLFV